MRATMSGIWGSVGAWALVQLGTMDPTFNIYIHMPESTAQRMRPMMQPTHYMNNKPMQTAVDQTSQHDAESFAVSCCWIKSTSIHRTTITALPLSRMAC